MACNPDPKQAPRKNSVVRYGIGVVLGLAIYPLLMMQPVTVVSSTLAGMYSTRPVEAQVFIATAFIGLCVYRLASRSPSAHQPFATLVTPVAVPLAALYYAGRRAALARHDRLRFSTTVSTVRRVAGQAGTIGLFYVAPTIGLFHLFAVTSTDTFFQIGGMLAVSAPLLGVSLAWADRRVVGRVVATVQSGHYHAVRQSLRWATVDTLLIAPFAQTPEQETATQPIEESDDDKPPSTVVQKTLTETEDQYQATNESGRRPFPKQEK